MAKTKRQSKGKVVDTLAQCICPICEERIVDATDKLAGQDSIKCEGRCNSWLHRKCAGLSTAVFADAMQSLTAFCCSNCKLEEQGSEIIHLKLTVSKLLDEIAELKANLTSSTTPCDPAS